MNCEKITRIMRELGVRNIDELYDELSNIDYRKLRLKSPTLLEAFKEFLAYKFKDVLEEPGEYIDVHGNVEIANIREFKDKLIEEAEYCLLKKR